MKKIIYQAHIILGTIVSIPLLAWALSGLLYSLPNTVEGGSVEKIDSARVLISPAVAISKANEAAGRQLPVTALTLLMRGGRPQYQSIGGLGADSIFVDAESGKAAMAEPPTWKTAFFRQAHFYFFAGEWQVPLLIAISLLSAFSVLTGIYLNVGYWRRKI
jgi:uncharacterized iron-regulated membrane protein